MFSVANVCLPSDGRGQDRLIATFLLVMNLGCLQFDFKMDLTQRSRLAPSWNRMGDFRLQNY